MSIAVFTFKGTVTKIQCFKEDKMKNICYKFASKIEKELLK